MKVSILDDYFDTLRTLPCFARLAGHEVEIFNDHVQDVDALAERLRELGFDITLEEAEARGRGMTGRPHFARILMEKGYVKSIRQAFDDYLDESAKGYVYRREPQFVVSGGRKWLVLPGDPLSSEPPREPPPPETRFELVDGRWLARSVTGSTTKDTMDTKGRTY